MLGPYSLWPRYFPNKKADEKKKGRTLSFPREEARQVRCNAKIDHQPGMWIFSLWLTCLMARVYFRNHVFPSITAITDLPVSFTFFLLIYYSLTFEESKRELGEVGRFGLIFFYQSAKTWTATQPFFVSSHCSAASVRSLTSTLTRYFCIQVSGLSRTLLIPRI